MNFFLKLFNSFIFKNIDNLLDLGIFAKLFSEQVPHHGAGSIHIGQIADHNWVIRQWACTLIVILLFFDQHVSDSDKY